MRYIHINIVALVLTSMTTFCATAQTSKIHLSFDSTDIKTELNGTVETVLKIQNTSATIIEGSLNIISQSKDLRLVQQQAKQIKLKGNESLFVVVKAIVSQKASLKKSITLEASFTILETNEIIKIALPILIQEKRVVRMLLPETNFFYEHPGDTLYIPVRLNNEGNTPQNITVQIRYPNFMVDLKKTTVTLREFSDTLVVFKKRITREILSKENLSISITSFYQNGDIIGIATFDAIPIKQKRRYIIAFVNDDNRDFNNQNQVSVSRVSNHKSYAIYSLFLNAQALTKAGKIYGNLDLNWWEQSNQMILRNSWIGYKEKNFGLQAGNISKFDMLNLAGRGLETFFVPSSKNKIEMGVLQKSYSVIDFSSPPSGESAWINYIYKNGWEKGAKISLLYDHNTFEKTEKEILSSEFSVIKNPRFSLQIGTAFSRMEFYPKSETQFGGAAEVNIIGKNSYLFYNSSNYLSSGYFAGTRSGTLILNENIRFNLKKNSFWVGFNHFSFAPKTTRNDLHQNPEYSTSQFNLGMSRRFKTSLISLSLLSSSEKRNEISFSKTALKEYELYKNGISFSANYFKNAQNVSLTLESGFFKTNLTNTAEFYFKTNLNYNRKFVNLTAYYQYNNFDLGEIIAAQKQTKKKYYKLLILPSFQADFLNQKIHLRAGLMYSTTTFVPHSLQINGRIDFDWNKNFKLFISNYYSEYARNFKPMNIIQFGLTKHFNPIKIKDNTSDLELFVYYDSTKNGATDPKNLPVPNQIVIINGKAFRTNQQGIINYRKLPPGDYEIQIMNTQNWYANVRKIKIEKSVKESIGLTKTGTIKGKISYLATDNSFPIEQKLAGLSLILTDENGVEFKTKTDDNGLFVFYVPKNTYTVTLEKQGLSDYVSILSNSLLVQAIPEKINEVSFQLQIKERRVEIKKFGAKKF